MFSGEFRRVALPSGKAVGPLIGHLDTKEKGDGGRRWGDGVKEGEFWMDGRG